MQKNELSLGFVGDVMLGELLENVGVGVKTKIEEGIDPFEKAKSYLQSVDILVGNLECVLSKNSTRKGIYSMLLRAPPEYGGLLKDAGFKVMNIANNHILDHGQQAYEDTIKTLRNYKILPIGNPSQERFEDVIKVIKVKGWSVGFLGYNLSNLSNSKLFEARDMIIEDIKKYRGDVDILVLSLHWGYEYVNFPSWPFTLLAREFVNNGVDIIYGHHTHQIQGVVEDSGKIIAFSLGNFIFDDLRKENRRTMMLRIKIKENRALKYELIPFFINRNFQPVPNKSMQIYIENINKLARTIYFESNPNKIKLWHKRAWHKSRRGHFKNRIRIRVRILKRPFIYFKYWKDLYKNIV